MMNFFGARAAVAVSMIASRRRILRQGSDPNLKVNMTGGVPIPVDRRRMVAGSVGLVIFGLVLAATGRPIGDDFVTVSPVLAGFGGLVSVFLALG